MRRILLFYCFLLIIHSLSAQKGAPLLTHFRNSREIENQSWAISQDKNKVMLFANRKGILSFDGEDWIPARIQITPFSLEENPYDGKIYAGGDNNYGFIEKDKKGLYRYKSLSGDTAGLGLVTKIIFRDSLACFYGEQSVSIFNLKTNLLEHRFKSLPQHPFTGIFMTSKNTFINVSDKGLYRIESDTLFSIVSGYLTEKDEILFSLPYNDKLVLVGLGNSKLSLFDGMKYYNYPVRDDGYIKDNILSEGIILGDSLYAFSTLEGGVVVLEKSTGKVRFIINNQNGLPDDEIFAMGYDANGGLWLSHPFGLTRADLSLPVENFSIYPGIKGNPAASLKHKNDLYVATSEGVFWLSNEKSYTEMEVVRKNDFSSGEISNPSSQNTAATDTPPASTNTRKKLLSRIFGKKNETEANQKATVVKADAVVEIKAAPVEQYSTQKIRKLKSIDYNYKKINGLNDKCRQLVSTSHGILAATNRGLYVIDNYRAVPVLENRYINFISWMPEAGTYAVATANGYFLASFVNGKWKVTIPDEDFKASVYSITQSGKYTLWLGGDNVAYRAEISPETGKADYKQYTIQNSYSQRYFLNLINDTVFLFTESGVSTYNENSGNFDIYKTGYSEDQSDGFAFPQSNIPLIGLGTDWIYPERDKRIKDRELSVLRLFDDIVSVNCEEDNIWIVNGNNQLFGINRKKVTKIAPCNDLFVKNIKNENGTSFELSDIVFGRGDNVIDFEIVAPSYLKKNLTEYQYFIDKVMTEWSPWSTQAGFKRAIPRAGDYTLLVRARDFWGEVGEPVTVSFTMKAPFTRTTIFYLLIIALVLYIIFLIVRFREKQFQEKNLILEEKVKERTAEIEAQKEEITSSIAYASRIQMAMLPVSDLFTESFSEYFIIFKPRDIVSGDFYWIGEDEKNIFLTVADCTGHGVPGAFMSTLGISSLSEIITNSNDLHANMVLNHLREKIKKSLHQTGKEGEAADGMDISFCVLKKNRKMVQYSGAFNPMFFCSNGDLKEYKGDRMPIGIHYGAEASFTNHEINVKKGDVLYLMSDGMTDQFGGPEGSKFKKAQLKKLLSEIHGKPMLEQKRNIENEFIRWKGSHSQVDDITIIGVRI